MPRQPTLGRQPRCSTTHTPMLLLCISQLVVSRPLSPRPALHVGGKSGQGNGPGHLRSPGAADDMGFRRSEHPLADPPAASTGCWSGLRKSWRTFLLLAQGVSRQLDATSAVNGVAQPMVALIPPTTTTSGTPTSRTIFYVWLRRSSEGCVSRSLLDAADAEVAGAGRRCHIASTEAGRTRKRISRPAYATAFERIHEAHAPDYPMTLFYAFKQAEADKDGLASTGWETMLEGLLGSGFMVTGTWPMRTERGGRIVAIGTAALASSIVLVCRPRPETAALATRKEFTAALRAELPEALPPTAIGLDRAGRSCPGGDRPGHGGLLSLLEGG